MSDIKAKFGSAAQAFTITIASLANNACRSSVAIDNSTNLFLDALVSVKIKSAAASTSATGYVNIYAYGSTDTGTTYAENGGLDSAITLTSPPNVRLIGSLNVVANAVTYISEPMSVAAAFGGALPQYWGIMIENKTAATLDATGGSHYAQYQGVYGQVG